MSNNSFDQEVATLLGPHPLWYALLTAPALRTAAVRHYNTTEQFYTNHHDLIDGSLSSTNKNNDTSMMEGVGNNTSSDLLQNTPSSSFRGRRDVTPVAASVLSASEHRFMGMSNVRTSTAIDPFSSPSSTSTQQPQQLRAPRAGNIVSYFKNNRSGSTDGSPSHLPPHLTSVPIRPAFYSSGNRDLLSRRADSLRSEVDAVQGPKKVKGRGHTITKPSTLPPVHLPGDSDDVNDKCVNEEVEGIQDNHSARDQNTINHTTRPHTADGVNGSSRTSVSSIVRRPSRPADLVASGSTITPHQRVGSIVGAASFSSSSPGEVEVLEDRAATAMRDGLAGVIFQMPTETLRILFRPTEVDFRTASVSDNISVADGVEVSPRGGGGSGGFGHLLPTPTINSAEPSDALAGLALRESLFLHAVQTRELRPAGLLHALTNPSISDKMRKDMLEALLVGEYGSKGGGWNPSSTTAPSSSPSSTPTTFPLLRDSVQLLALRNHLQNLLLPCGDDDNATASNKMANTSFLRSIIEHKKDPLRVVLQWIWTALVGAPQQQQSTATNDTSSNTTNKGTQHTTKSTSPSFAMDEATFVVVVSQLMSSLHGVAGATTSTQHQHQQQSALTSHASIVAAVRSQWAAWEASEAQSQAPPPLSGGLSSMSSVGGDEPQSRTVPHVNSAFRRMSASNVHASSSTAPSRFGISFSRFELYITNNVIMPWVRKCSNKNTITNTTPSPSVNTSQHLGAADIDDVSPIRRSDTTTMDHTSSYSHHERRVGALLMLTFLSVGPSVSTPPPPVSTPQLSSSSGSSSSVVLYCDGLGGDIRHLRLLITNITSSRKKATTGPPKVVVGNNNNGKKGDSSDKKRLPSTPPPLPSRKQQHSTTAKRPTTGSSLLDSAVAAASAVDSPVSDRLATMSPRLAISNLKRIMMDPSLRPLASVVAEEELLRQQRIEEIASPYAPLSTLRRDPLTRTTPDQFNLERVLMARLARQLVAEEEIGTSTNSEAHSGGASSSSSSPQRRRIKVAAADDHIATLSPSSLQYILQQVHKDYDESQPHQTGILFDGSKVPKSLGATPTPLSPSQRQRATDIVHQERVFLEHKRDIRGNRAAHMALHQHGGTTRRFAAEENFTEYLRTGIITEEYATQLAQLHPHVMRTLKVVVGMGVGDGTHTSRPVSPVSASKVGALCAVLSSPAVDADVPPQHQLHTGRSSPARQGGFRPQSSGGDSYTLNNPTTVSVMRSRQQLMGDPSVSVGTSLHKSTSMYTRPPSALGSSLGRRPRTPVVDVTASTLPMAPHSRPASGTAAPIVFADGRAPSYVPQFFTPMTTPHVSLFLPKGAESASRPPSSPGDLARQKILEDQANRRNSVGSLVGGRMTISRQGARNEKPQHHSLKSNTSGSVVAVASDTIMMDLSATGTPRRPQTAPSIPAAQDHVSPVRVKDVDARLGALEVKKANTSSQDGSVVVRAGTTTNIGSSSELPSTTANVSHRPVSAKDREVDGRPLELIAPMAVLPVSHAPFTRGVTSSGSTPRK